jgi:O-antigen ligase
MLSRLGIETRLQLAVTVCVISLIVVTTLGNSGGAPWVYFTYRTLLILIAVLCAIGSRRQEQRISPVFSAAVVLLFTLMLTSVLRIQGALFEGLYLWYKYVFFACAFLSLAKYARYQSAQWRSLLLGSVVVVSLAHLIPDFVLGRSPFVGFSHQNANYFATFLLVALAAAAAVAVFGVDRSWRIAAACSAAIVCFGILKTFSRGGTLAALAMLILVALRARGRISRQAWLAAGLVGLVTAIASSPYLIRKFVDRGQIDPYNYARTEIWRSSLPVVTHNPFLGVGFGQFTHISKRYTLPVAGTVARYMKRAQMAHNEYLQHMAEQGIPAGLLLFSLLGYLVFLIWKRGQTAWPEYQPFHEAALLTATGVGLHALVDNCWTIPVTASTLVVFSLADPLPLHDKQPVRIWKAPYVVFATVALAVIYVYSTLIPGLGLYYNDLGHQAYDRYDYATAERYHLKALRSAPNHPLFLDNLGMVYLQASIDQQRPMLLEPARMYFARAIAASPQQLDPHIHMETALLRSLTGDPTHDSEIDRQIIAVDSELLQIDPFLPFARKNLGSAYYNLDRRDEAFQQLAIAIQYEPNFVPGYLQLASWSEQRGDVDSNRRYTATAMTIVNKYRDFKPTEGYEGVLLGRPSGAVKP